MSILVELYQLEYLRPEHLKTPPRLRVDRFDARFHGMLSGAVGRAICGLLVEKMDTAGRVDVFIVKKNSEYVGGPQLPFVRICSDEPEMTVRATKALREYFTEDVKIMVVPLARFRDL